MKSWLRWELLSAQKMDIYERRAGTPGWPRALLEEKPTGVRFVHGNLF